MEYSNDQDLRRLYPIEHGVRKVAHHGAANVLIDDLVELWIDGDAIQHVPHAVRELRPPPGPLLVPIRRIVEFGPRFGAKDDRQTHCRNLARASASIVSQGITSPGLV